MYSVAPPSASLRARMWPIQSSRILSLCESLVKNPIPWTPTSSRHSPGIQSNRRARFASNAFTHMDFGPTSLKVNLVHECFHQVDATATLGQNVFNRCWIQNFGGIKPFSLVLDDNRNS